MNLLKMIKGKLNIGTSPVVGLDLGSSHVKIVQVDYQQGLPQLMGFCCQKIESATKEGYSEAILKALNMAGIKSKEVRLSLGGEAIIVRYIQMPKITDEELSNAIDFEAEKYIPFKRDEVCLDFQVLEREYHFDKNKMRILLVAARKDFINQQIELIQQAGMGLSLINVDSFSLINAFLAFGQGSPEQTIGLLNIGARRTNINIIRNNLPFFTRDISIGGDNLTQIIKDKMKVSPQEADKLKFELEDFGNEPPEILRPVLENLLGEIRLSFDYFENQIERGMDMIYLTGGSSVIKGLDKYFSDKLGLSVQCWNPAKSISTSADVSSEKLKSEGASLGVCLGLTVRGV